MIEHVVRITCDRCKISWVVSDEPDHSPNLRFVDSDRKEFSFEDLCSICQTSIIRALEMPEVKA